MELGVKGEQGRQSFRHLFPLPAGFASLASFFWAQLFAFLPQGPLVRRPIIATPGLNLNPVYFSFVQKHFPYSF